jgi:2-oxoacid:acceptor oxidoreductase delta subunit (pyruvate/2-ketoisovalerate family)
MSDQEKNWQDLPLGGVIVQAGNAVDYPTGGWRAFRPRIEWKESPKAKGCTHCLVCWLYCPDSSMIVRDGELKGVDLEHCKGCGICARVCPVGCITMIEEGAAP